MWAQQNSRQRWGERSEKNAAVCAHDGRAGNEGSSQVRRQTRLGRK